jgi:hypothetical protein
MGIVRSFVKLFVRGLREKSSERRRLRPCDQLMWMTSPILKYPDLRIFAVSWEKSGWGHSQKLVINVTRIFEQRERLS